MTSLLPGELVASGTRSEVRAFGRGAVIKLPASATADGWIRWEAEYAEAARQAGAPVPRLLGLERIGARTASVWERVEGRSIWQHAIDRPHRAAELGRLLANVQEELFALVPPVTLPRQRDRILSKIRRATVTIDPAFGRAAELMPEPAGPARLCHGDLHPSNVLLAAGGPMLVDWFDASQGEALADVARSLLTLRSDGVQPPPHLPGADAAMLRVLTEGYRARLAENHDLAGERFARWEAVSAVARMAEGVPRTVLVEVWASFTARGDYAAAG